MPVVIKTPLHPIVIAPPQRSAPGDWQNQQDEQGTECLFNDPQGQLGGFVLSGDYVERKQALTKQLPRRF
jgi:rubredoxin-NAD+ reductase